MLFINASYFCRIPKISRGLMCGTPIPQGAAGQRACLWFHRRRANGLKRESLKCFSQIKDNFTRVRTRQKRVGGQGIAGSLIGPGAGAAAQARGTRRLRSVPRIASDRAGIGTAARCGKYRRRGRSRTLPAASGRKPAGQMSPVFETNMMPCPSRMPKPRAAGFRLICSPVRPSARIRSSATRR